MIKRYLLLILIFVAPLLLSSGCSHQGYTNKVKVVRPIKRFALYKPKKDKRRKRVRTVTYRSH